MISWQPPRETARPHNWRRDFYDLQQVPWTETLRVTRSDARAVRDAWYTSYHNLDYSQLGHAKRLPQHETFFRESSMHTSHKASIEHFQLRNLMSTPAHNTVHYASRSKIFSWTPSTGDARCLIDMSQADPESGFLGPVKISTMKTAHGLTIAGGFCGEYALRSSNRAGAGIKGLVTPDFNDGITNHVDIIPNRTGPSPTGVFASNDKHLRILDTETNIFTSDQELSQPINCTATSPDSRLRVVIGDSPDAWIIESDTGRPVHPLRGHRDFGFACAWSPDMRHIATSNQDKTVIIWDARTWRPLETIDSDVAGYRSLRFSPVGGGPRTLLCTEPADRISIVDAQLYRSRQVHDFFGEIGGADYSPDGGEIWVANTDVHFGGFMKYERRQWGRRVGLTDLPSEWATEAELEVDPRCVSSMRERGLRFMRGLSDAEHESLIL
jgi:WD40 repeat protein